MKAKESRRQDVWLGLFVLIALGVLVTGSLYLVGEILGVLSGERVPGPVSM